MTKIFLTFLCAGILVFCFPMAVRAESSWICTVKVKAIGPTEMVIVEAEKDIQGPCLDYKKGQTYTISSTPLVPSRIYSFQITIPEYMDPGKAHGEAISPKWVLVKDETEQ